MLKILHVVGARPNFMKADPVIRAMRKAGGFRQTLVHTGQHYDEAMSQAFFSDLGMKKPDIDLGVGRRSRTEATELTEGESKKNTSPRSCHAEQIAEIMTRFEPVLLKKKPDWVFVYGDVNSTVACARVASKHGAKIAHVESGLRSFDKTMPEEVNRIETDQLADLLFVTEKSGVENLKREGITGRKVKFVGNTMIDTLARLLPKARKRYKVQSSEFKVGDSADSSNLTTKQLNNLTADQSYALVTMHRPGNVDDPKTLARIMQQLELVARDTPVLFPIHPRTAKLLSNSCSFVSMPLPAAQVRGLPRRRRGSITLLPPQGYLDFLALQANAAVVVTDSGGIQEETSYLGTPCLTVRPNTERPVTIEKGTNRLIKIAQIRKQTVAALSSGLKFQVSGLPQNRLSIPKWDGHAAERIVEVMTKLNHR